eukprot:gene26290-biopygen15586
MDVPEPALTRDDIENMAGSCSTNMPEELE